MSNDKGGGGKLYDAVASTSRNNLRSAVEKVDGLSPEDEEALDRGGRFALRGTLRRIARWTLWVLFGLGVVSALAFLIAVAYLTHSYLTEAVAKGEAGIVLSAILTFLAGVATTLGIEFLWHLSTNGKSND